jgi:hypothetical protein
MSSTPIFVKQYVRASAIILFLLTEEHFNIPAG